MKYLDADSLGTTKFEPTPEVQSPRSPASPASNFPDVDYNTATFFQTMKDEISKEPHSEIDSIHNNKDTFFSVKL